MTKKEMINFIRSEIADYRRIMHEYEKMFGKDSEQFRVAQGKFQVMWMLGNDLGIVDI